MGVGASILVWLALAIVPGDATNSTDPVAKQRVDLIELNHFIDQDGREVFRQVLFYDWSPRHRQYIIRAWRLVKNDSLIPRRRWSPSGFECVWHDDGVLRHVMSGSFRETWTQHDPERANRLIVAEEDRVPLIQPRQLK